MVPAQALDPVVARRKAFLGEFVCDETVMPDRYRSIRGTSKASDRLYAIGRHGFRPSQQIGAASKVSAFEAAALAGTRLGSFTKATLSTDLLEVAAAYVPSDPLGEPPELLSASET